MGSLGALRSSVSLLGVVSAFSAIRSEWSCCVVFVLVFSFGALVYVCIYLMEARVFGSFCYVCTEVWFDVYFCGGHQACMPGEL